MRQKKIVLAGIEQKKDECKVFNIKTWLPTLQTFRGTTRAKAL